MTISLRHALLAVVVLLPACTNASTAAPAPARRAPVAVPTASPSPSADVEVAPPTEIIDPATGEQLAMRGSATMSIAVAGKTTTQALVQSEQADTILEQNEGETERVLRLATADPQRADDVQFTVDGIAKPGTFKTGESDLTVVFYDAPHGVDLLSDRGDCTVVFERIDARGATGRVTCAEIDTPTGKAQLSATFKAEATDTP